MEPDRWQRIEELYQAALARKAADRPAYLAEACAGDASLRDEIEMLIAAGEQDVDPLNTSAIERAATNIAGEAQLQPIGVEAGQVVGNYRIVSRIGAGGMGTVFLAEDLKLGRKIAIKFLRDMMLEDEMARRRLVREARAAATLDHPNICTIHEVNVEGPLPFIVMQYIEGSSLAVRVKDHALEPKETVEIGIQIAEALAEAHTHRVIHRDIKPQNVIVSVGGRVKVLDFGLAKLLPEKESVETEANTLSKLTETGQVVGTPGYMSPELLKGEAVDSRTDIFSLGVLLYNCATGKSAFTGHSTLQICLKVIQTEPQKPSEINPDVPRGLERIILKAMAKDLKARYQSADELRADLLKLKAELQEGRTIPIRPVTDRLSLFGNKVTAATGVLRKRPFKALLLVAPLLLVPLIWFALPFFGGHAHEPPPEAIVWYEKGTDAIREGAYYQATRALNRAIEIDNKYALAHARLAEAYMEADSSDRAKEEILTALSLVPDRDALPKLDALYLEAIAASVRRELTNAIGYYQQIADQTPASARANAYMDLGRAYEKDEQVDKALDLYRQAARLAPGAAGAELRLAVLYGRKQDLKSATEAFERAEQNYRDLNNLEGVAEVLFQRGTMLYKNSKFQEARSQLEKAEAIARQIDNKHQMIRAQLQLGAIYIDDDTGLARRVTTEAINLAQTNNLRNLAVNGLIDFGNTFLFRGEFDEAGKYFKQALEFARADRAQKSEARALLALGSLYVLQINVDEGIPLLEQALSFYQTASYRQEASQALAMLGRAQLTKGDYEESTKIYVQQLQLAQELGNSQLMSDSHLNLAVILGLGQERYPEALPHIEEANKINRASGIPMYIGYTEMNRAAILWPLGRYDEARASLKEALSIASSRETGHKALLAWVQLIYAQMALSERNLAETTKRARQAMELAGTEYRDLTVQANYSLGLAEALAGSVEPAIKSCEEALRLARETKNPRLVASALLALSEVALMAGDAPRAFDAAREAEEMFARAGRQDSEWRALLVAARAAQLTGRAPQAEEYRSRADGLYLDLQQRWGAQAFAGYAKRPDIQSYRSQLTQLLSVNR